MNRRGIALLATLLALVVVLAVLWSALMVVLEETRLSDGARFEVQAAGLAEAAAARGLAAAAADSGLDATLSLIDATTPAGDSLGPWAGGRARIGLLVASGESVMSGSGPGIVQTYDSVVTLNHGLVALLALKTRDKSLIDSALTGNYHQKAIPSRPWIRLF